MRTNPALVRAKLEGVKMLVLLSVVLLFTGCATDRKKPKYASDRKWYQGTMDNEDRAFYIDSFFGGR